MSFHRPSRSARVRLAWLCLLVSFVLPWVARRGLVPHTDILDGVQGFLLAVGAGLLLLAIRRGELRSNCSDA